VAQVEFESKIEARFKADLSCFSFKRFAPGVFNVGLIGSTCTTLPSGLTTMYPAPAAKVDGESGMDESLRIITVM